MLALFVLIYILCVKLLLCVIFNSTLMSEFSARLSGNAADTSDGICIYSNLLIWFKCI